MKTRIFRNWRTSLLGGALLVAGIILLACGTLTGTEFIALLPTILGLLYIPDSALSNKLPNKIPGSRNELPNFKTQP